MQKLGWIQSRPSKALYVAEVSTTKKAVKEVLVSTLNSAGKISFVLTGTLVHLSQ